MKITHASWKIRGYWPFLLLFLLPFLVYWQLWWPINRQYIGNDFLLFWYPVFLQTQELMNNHIPFMDPGPFFGIPLIQRPDALITYPLVDLAIIVGALMNQSAQHFYMLLEGLTLLHLGLAGLGAFLLAKEVGIRRHSAYLVAVTYMLNGSMITFLNGFHHIVAQTMLPFMLLILIRLIAKPTIKSSLLLALAIMPLIQLFAWQHLLYSLVFLALFSLFEIRLNLERLMKISKFVLISVILASLMSLPVIISGLEVPKISERANLTYGLSGLSGSVRPRQLIDFFLPYLSSKNFGERELVEVFPDTLPYFYLGILPLLLIIPAFMRKDKRNIFFLGGFIITTLFTLGLTTPIFDFFYTTLFPLMKPFRNIAKAEYIGLLCAALLAGRGLQNFTDYYDEINEKIFQYRKFLAFGLMTLLAGVLMMATKLDQLLWTYPAGPITIGYFTNLNVVVLFLLLFGSAVGLFYARDRLNSGSFVILAIILVIFDLGMFAKNYPINFSGKDPSLFATSNEIIQKLEADPAKPYRVDVSLFPHNYAPSVSGVRHVDGYLVYYPKIQLNFYKTLHGAPRNKTAEQLAALRYIVSTTDLTTEGYILKDTVTANTSNQKNIYIHAQTPSGWDMASLGTKFGIYTLPDPLPFAHFVQEAIPMEDKNIAELIDQEAFNPALRAYTSGFEYHSNSKVGSEVSIVEQDPANIKLYVKSETGGFLVTSYPYYPDWRAQIDGKDVKVVRTNLAFIGLLVPPGNHQVNLIYYPRNFILSLKISLISLGVVILSLIYLIRKKG